MSTVEHVRFGTRSVELTDHQGSSRALDKRVLGVGSRDLGHDLIVTDCPVDLRGDSHARQRPS